MPTRRRDWDIQRGDRQGSRRCAKKRSFGMSSANGPAQDLHSGNTGHNGSYGLTDCPGQSPDQGHPRRIDRSWRPSGCRQPSRRQTATEAAASRLAAARLPGRGARSGRRGLGRSCGVNPRPRIRSPRPHRCGGQTPNCRRSTGPGTGTRRARGRKTGCTRRPAGPRWGRGPAGGTPPRICSWAVSSFRRTHSTQPTGSPVHLRDPGPLASRVVVLAEFGTLDLRSSEATAASARVFLSPSAGGWWRR